LAGAQPISFVVARSADIYLKPERRFEFDKRSQPFIRTHNKTLSVAAMCVSNPGCSPIGIARDVWKRHAKAFFWVRPLAGSPRIARAPAEQILIADLRLREGFCEPKFLGRTHYAVIRLYDATGNVIEVAPE